MSKMEKNRAVDIGYMLAGIVFLFNPIVGIVDILPDFIGCLLLYRGLYMLSFCTDKLRDTRGALWKLALVSVARTLSILAIPGKTESFTLLLVFVFGVLETIYTIPCILTLFDGFYDLGRRFNAESVYAPHIVKVKERKKEKGASPYTALVRREAAERLKAYWIVFSLVKTAATILPELTALDVDYALSSGSNYRMSLAMFKPHFYVLAALITLVFGILWLVRMLHYFTGMKKDAALAEGVSTHYREAVASDVGFVAAIRMKNVLLMFVLSSVALFPLQFDGVNLLPSVLFALIITLALRLLAQYDPLARFGYIASTAVSVLSVLGMFLQIPYFSEYIAKDARYLSNAIRLYKPIRILGTAEFVCALLLFSWFVFVLCRALKQHAHLVGGPSHGLQYSAEARAAEILKSVYARVAIVAVIGAAYIVLRAVSFTAAMYYEAMWGIEVAAALIFAAAVVYGVSAMNDLIYDRLENRY